MPEYKLKDKKSFKEEIVSMVVKIFELSCNEFRGGYFIKKDHGNWIEDIYVQDGKKVYCQAVETLSLVLSPHFILNKEEIESMKKGKIDYPKIKKIKENYDKLKKELENNLKKYNDGERKEKDRDEFSTNKLTLMKNMFEQLMILLKVLKINVVYGVKGQH